MIVEIYIKIKKILPGTHWTSGPVTEDAKAAVM